LKQRDLSLSLSIHTFLHQVRAVPRRNGIAVVVLRLLFVLAHAFEDLPMRTGKKKRRKRTIEKEDGKKKRKKAKRAHYSWE
jgi:hypothetical protein